MQVNIENVSPVKKKLNIEVPADQVDSEIEKVYAGIQKRANLKGFRKGKAPMTMIKKHYGDVMQEEVIKRLFEKTLFKALDDHKIEPVDQPVIEDGGLLEPGNPFSYRAVVEVMPEILLTDYKGLEVMKEKFSFSQDNVEAEIERMRENMAHLEPLDDGAVLEMGNVAIVDYSCRVDGHPDHDAEFNDVTVEPGSKRMLQEVEEALPGMKVGDQREIRITLPADYSVSELSGKEAVFDVTLKEIKKKELPELDDSFAQQFGDYENMEQLRAKLAEYYKKNQLDRIENDLKERIIKVLVDRNPMDVPESMVNRQLGYMYENFKSRLKSQHLSPEAVGLNESVFAARFRDNAEEKVKGGLLLMSLIEKEQITVNDVDMEQRYSKIAGDSEEMLPRIREFYASNTKTRNVLMAEIKEDKAIGFLLENARIVEVDAEQLKES